MATPIAAASAVLVRQYFVDGWYPTGLPVSSGGFNPSGALIKAMLIGGHIDLASQTSEADSPCMLLVVRARHVVARSSDLFI